VDPETVYVDVDRDPPPEGHHHQPCKRCPYWYGAEDDEYGPCSLKTARDQDRFLTFADWACDEGLYESDDEGEAPW
jgi:hypothetical protein